MLSPTDHLADARQREAEPEWKPSDLREDLIQVLAEAATEIFNIDPGNPVAKRLREVRERVEGRG